MRRISFLILITLLSLVAIGTPGRSVQTSAHDDATPGAASKHPIVGTWEIDTDADDPENLPSLLIAGADGSYLEVDAGGGIGVGRWESTGDQTADLNIWFLASGEDDASGGYGRVRAVVEISGDGQSFTAEYTIEFVSPDGTTTGEYGPATASGTRLSVEPMGSPVGTLDELFEEGTPTP
jgi:hypothetical protein